MVMASHRSAWAAMLALTSAAACGESDPAGSGGTAQGGAGPSGPVTTTTGSGPVTATGTTTAQATSSTGVGGSSFVCDPPAEPGSLYELFAESFDFNVLEPVSMCEYRDQVLLIVNTAAL